MDVRKEDGKPVIVDYLSEDEITDKLVKYYEMVVKPDFPKATLSDAVLSNA